jgi:predicted TPR repeat methyltransferase
VIKKNKQNNILVNNTNPNKEEFEKLYITQNPWGIDGSLNDRVRQKILNEIFSDIEFEYGVDIGCGEGFMTARLDFIQNVVGIDISETAIGRAMRSYPGICFMAGNAFKDKLLEQEFDFVSCFEVLYYPVTREERIQALKSVKQYGHKYATFAFSVVSVGENKHRKYFSKTEFIELLLETGYSIESITGFVANTDNVVLRIMKKIISMLPMKLACLLFSKIIKYLPDKMIYQHLFICKR